MSLTAVHAQNTYVALEDPTNAGTFIDVSAKSHNVRMPMTRGDVDTSTFGQGDMTNLTGMRDASFTLDTYGDAALNTLLYNLWMSGSPWRVRYGPEGSVTGKERWTFYANMSSFEPGGGVTTVNAATAN